MISRELYDWYRKMLQNRPGRNIKVAAEECVWEWESELGSPIIFQNRILIVKGLELQSKNKTLRIVKFLVESGRM